MRIKLNTTFTPYNKETSIKPKHPLWMIKNNNGTVLYINDDFLLQGTYGQMGVDAMKVLVPIIQHYIDTGGKEKIEIINDTQFKVSGSKIFNGPIDFTLIETSIEIVP
jgi:hypothetical protein